MNRRGVLKGAAALAAGAAGGLPAPAIAQASERVLRFVPQANLVNFDPIWGTQAVVRTASMLVWDTIDGIDNTFTPRWQMVEFEEGCTDGLSSTFHPRPGLRWHDGELVLARDCVASLKRWIVRDGMGQMTRALRQELVAVDARTFRLRLSAPHPKLLFALGKNNTPIAFMMPERIAETAPFQQITEFVGSGPMRFNRPEWVPGACAIWSRFEQDVPRDEPPNWLAGGKRMLVDRIEWLVQPDQATVLTHGGQAANHASAVGGTSSSPGSPVRTAPTRRAILGCVRTAKRRGSAGRTIRPSSVGATSGLPPATRRKGALRVRRSVARR